MRRQGKVAAVLSAFDVALNIGATDGVKVDDIATVLRLVEVKDPDTGDILGTIRRARLRLRVREVQSKLSVATTYEMVTQESTSSLVFIPNQPLRQRITTSNNLVDFRTVLVSVGDEVDVTPAPRAAKG